MKIEASFDELKDVAKAMEESSNKMDEMRRNMTAKDFLMARFEAVKILNEQEKANK